MNNIGIFNETDENIDFDLKSLLEFALKKESLKNIEFNIIFINNDRIKQLNKEYRNIDNITDVISFALEDYDKSTYDNVRVLGDVYISLEQAKKQSIDYDHSYQREISFLSIHGLLHLLGYDHMDEKQEKIMFNKQEDILNEYGIKR